MINVPILAEASQDVFSSVMTDEFSLGDKIVKSLQMMGMGMGTVFAVLFVIWFCLVLFKFFMSDIPEKRKAKKNASVLTSAPDESETETVSAQTNGDDVTVAVIVAAVQAYMDSEGNSVPFRVVSFKRKRPTSPWNNN